MTKRMVVFCISSLKSNRQVVGRKGLSGKTKTRSGAGVSIIFACHSLRPLDDKEGSRSKTKRKPEDKPKKKPEEAPSAVDTEAAKAKAEQDALDAKLKAEEELKIKAEKARIEHVSTYPLLLL